ncbi:hypothetical protein IMZ11_33735 [Microtetraspora sp. AC03309]|uniref:hypothetical protein n=1 Tax=Microtetraspora sp. AC03309 TaxID=2779376 RepID=UPI001E41C774|nr:hypothetical protein [Microtetraspora sp. AC03309]MCC5580591.1 hypothetical protein [Microtetraspora sp. AC03309]
MNTIIDLPIHPRTGLRAIGVLPSGRIVWPVLGGSGDGDGGDTGQGGDGGQGDAGQDGGGDKTFTQADLDRVVAERLARERAKYADYNDLKTKASAFDKAQADQQSENEKAIAKAREETRTEVLTEVRRERLLDKIEVLAAGKFADPEDARLRLASRVDEFITDGQVDVKAIEGALAALLKDKPHLAGGGRRFEGGGDGGPRGGGKQPTLEERIREAESKGDWKTARQLKTQLMLQPSK